MSASLDQSHQVGDPRVEEVADGIFASARRADSTACPPESAEESAVVSIR